MNFRPKSTLNQLPLRFHQLLVLTGFRPPIATTLRSLIIPTTTSTPPSIARASSDIRCRTLSPCHIILCNGYYTTIIEKDLNTHSTRSSRSFITQTNHDITHWLARNELADGDRFAFPDSQTNPYPAPPSNFNREDPEIIRKYFPYLCWEDSKNRYEFLREQWIVVPDEPGQDTPAVAVEKVKSWIRQEPVNNEETHFMCLLDPLTGEIQWLERGREANLDVWECADILECNVDFYIPGLDNVRLFGWRFIGELERDSLIPFNMIGLRLEYAIIWDGKIATASCIVLYNMKSKKNSFQKREFISCHAHWSIPTQYTSPMYVSSQKGNESKNGEDHLIHVIQSHMSCQYPFISHWSHTILRPLV